MTLYLASPGDFPHLPSPHLPGWTACRRRTDVMKEITELQAQVYLSGARCPQCAPTSHPQNRSAA